MSEACNCWINARSGRFIWFIHLPLLFEFLFNSLEHADRASFPSLSTLSMRNWLHLQEKHISPFPIRKASVTVISATYWWTHSHKSSMFQRQNWHMSHDLHCIIQQHGVYFLNNESQFPVSQVKIDDEHILYQNKVI